MYKKGLNQYEVAEALGVSQASVSRWINMEKNGGKNGLISKPRPGPTPRLSQSDKKKLMKILLKGPKDNGFEGNIWRSQNVTEIIKKNYGITYHPGSVRKILRQMGFNLKTPIKSKAELAFEKAINKLFRRARMRKAFKTREK